MSTPRVAPPVLDGYTHVEYLGGGGFADVFRYEQVGLGRQVAIKVLHQGLGAASLASFRSEANLMAKLSNHPSIVSIFDTGSARDGRPYLVMEMCPSAHLGARIARNPFRVPRALDITIQIAGAVETAHRLGILHRDIKPANILFTEFGRPALTDFGISVSTETGQAGIGQALSPLWAPPEQFGGSSEPMGPASDVYSLAATLWAMLVGHSPMEVPGAANDTLAVGARVRTMPPPRTGRPDVPESLERVLATAMAKSPSQRYPSALSLARALQAVQVEQHLPVMTIDILDDDPDEAAGGVVETGTSIAGFMLIDPELDRARAHERGLTQTAAPHVLQHGRGIATPIAPLDFTAPGMPPPGQQPTVTAPAAHPEPPMVERRRIWPFVVTFVAVTLAAGAAWPFVAAHRSAAEPAPTTTTAAKPHDPVGSVIAPVTGLKARQTGKVVTVTWTNPDPREGDSFEYQVQDPSQATAPELTQQTTVRVAALKGQTCVSVRVQRSGRLSDEKRVCATP